MPTPLFEKWNPWWPWRPPWQRSVETLFRDAIEKIAQDNPEVKDVERDLVITLLAKAKKWDMRALEMYLDRLYWKPKQSTDIKHSWTIAFEDMSSLTPKQLEEERNKLL